jgi:phenylpropionate dioxygenase-like ring-hydroxylating dioxygenase large terminal subunit
MIDPILLHDWHVVGDCDSLARHGTTETSLFGQSLSLHIDEGGTPLARQAGRALATRIRYGLIWTSLGNPARDIVRFPECEEPDRHVLLGGAVGVHVSGLRAVENFLDMAHFPFVHTAWLGIEPHTEVRPCRISVTEADEILIEDCIFYQPIASPTASDGIDVDYIYKVLRPYTVVLYKTNPLQPHRKDFIALMLQPVEEERCIAHSLLAYLKDGIDSGTVRWFMQLIFGQDKRILENQRPLRLPLDPRAENPARADAVSLAYRRWLSGHRLSYGAIPPASARQSDAAQ